MAKCEPAEVRQVTESFSDSRANSPSRLYRRTARTSNTGTRSRGYKRRGMDESIQYAFIRSDLGLLILGATERGLAFLRFGESEQELRNAVQVQFPAATIAENVDAMGEWIDEIRGYLNGKVQSIELPVDMKGTDFEKAVWNYLRLIPPGETRSYSDVAAAIGRPKAVRAVARACASNRIAIAIPCHRVIRQDGGLGGYRWGLERKQGLLYRERPGQQS